MDRLTPKNWSDLSRGECCRMAAACVGPGLVNIDHCEGCMLPRLYAKLAKYEDIGLQPEQIDPYVVRPLKAQVRRVRK